MGKRHVCAQCSEARRLSRNGRLAVPVLTFEVHSLLRSSHGRVDHVVVQLRVYMTLRCHVEHRPYPFGLLIDEQLLLHEGSVLRILTHMRQLAQARHGRLLLQWSGRHVAHSFRVDGRSQRVRFRCLGCVSFPHHFFVKFHFFVSTTYPTLG